MAWLLRPVLINTTIMQTTKLMRACKQFNGTPPDFTQPSFWSWQEINRISNPSFIRTLCVVYIGDVEVRREKTHVFDLPLTPGAAAKEKYTSIVYYVYPHGNIKTNFKDAIISAVSLMSKKYLQ